MSLLEMFQYKWNFMKELRSEQTGTVEMSEATEKAHLKQELEALLLISVAGTRFK